MTKFYITNAIPYVNARPHIGHALEFVQTDAIARWKKLQGFDVRTLCGGDENAVKNVQAAEAAGKPIQEFIDENNSAFVALTKALDVHFDVWQKGSDTTHHYLSSQELWKRCAKNGDIYQKAYTGLYCVGCELFYEKNELNEKGECSEHPGKKLEEVSEENYFFRLSKYQKNLIELITSVKLAITPAFRANEVLSFLKEPLLDISISRSNRRARNWGIPVPNDPTQRIYVWFDALNIYQSGIGFGWDEKEYNKWWPADVHVIGKGISRFHAVYWPAFLLSAKLPIPKQLFVHGYITVNGQKMSKTIGNVIDPFTLIEKYGVDALRYYFLREIPSYDDGDFSERRFKELYNADLANELGNLVSRLAKLQSNSKFKIQNSKLQKSNSKFEKLLDEFKFNDALSLVWEDVKQLNRYINEKEPWKLEGDLLKEVLNYSITQLLAIAYLLQAFLPSTAEKINAFIQTGELAKPLFPRIS